MTCAQEMLEKGRAEGETRKQVEIIEGLLQAGVSWIIIETVTGLTEEAFQKLKAQVASSGS